MRRLKKLAAAFAALPLALIAVNAATATPALAANDYAWVYSQQNYGGTQYGLYRDNGHSGRVLVGFNVNSVVNQSSVGTLCGFSNAAGGVRYGFNAGRSFSYVGVRSARPSL